MGGCASFQINRSGSDILLPRTLLPVFAHITLLVRVGVDSNSSRRRRHFVLGIITIELLSIVPRPPHPISNAIDYRGILAAVISAPKGSTRRRNM
jgi:hypothetical protein